MELMLNNDDIDSFSRIYYKMNAYISKKTMTAAKENISFGVSVFDVLIKLTWQEPAFRKRKISDLKDDFSYLKNRKPLEVINCIMNTLGYYEYLERQSTNKDFPLQNLMDRIYNLKIIGRSCSSIKDYLEYLERLENMVKNSKNTREGNKLILSTVHAAKGLEYEEVYMVDLLQGIFPTAAADELSDHDQEIRNEEERRLFYVGMTRAKKRLMLSYPHFIDKDDGFLIIDFEDSGEKRLVEGFCISGSFIRTVS